MNDLFAFLNDNQGALTALSAFIAAIAGIVIYLLSYQKKLIDGYSDDKLSLNKQIATETAKREKQIATNKAKLDKVIATETAERHKQIAANKAKLDKAIATETAERHKQIATNKAKLDKAIATEAADREKQIAADKLALTIKLAADQETLNKRISDEKIESQRWMSSDFSKHSEKFDKKFNEFGEKLNSALLIIQGHTVAKSSSLMTLTPYGKELAKKFAAHEFVAEQGDKWLAHCNIDQAADNLLIQNTCSNYVSNIFGILFWLKPAAISAMLSIKVEQRKVKSPESLGLSLGIMS